MTPYQHFVQEFNKSALERKTVTIEGKLNYTIHKDKINALFDNYLLPLVDYDEALEFIYQPDDLPLLKLLFRAHFKMWIEIDEFHNTIILYKNFPKAFKIIKEVNKENHWFTPKTFPVGTILHTCPDPFGICNWKNGIPLSEDLKPIENVGIIPVIQINYDFLEKQKN